ncbi:MAG: hypothetical protein PHR77_20660 [Kiritimatiellae bacterium]|nr:hypothetical protein [Kiritimatiellia bacterium]MDD5523134.1 hypothetical protein [Kiritimatiellia bacterium]
MRFIHELSGKVISCNLTWLALATGFLVVLIGSNTVRSESNFRTEVKIGADRLSLPVQKPTPIPGLPKTGIYGVRIDRSTPAVNECERIFDSIGLNSYAQIEGVDFTVKDDFLNVHPFSKMRECNVEKSGTGTVKITYTGEAGFSRVKDTFIEIPLFYMNRYFKGKFDYRLISAEQKPGFFPAPMFVENGKVLNRVYVAVYETSVVDGVARSITGVIADSCRTINDYRQLYYLKGAGFCAMDARTIMSLQHLFLVRFANKNSQVTIGDGFVELRQPEITMENAGATTNRVIIKESAKTADVYWFVGQNVAFTKKGLLVETARLLRIEKGVPLTGRNAFTIDKTLFLDRSWKFGSAAQNTGYCDMLTHDCGRSRQNSMGKSGTDHCGVKLFGMENLWGNAWCRVDGLVVKSLVAYVGNDVTAYNNNAAGYMPLKFRCLAMSDNGTVGDNHARIVNLGIDDANPWFALADSFGHDDFPVTGKSGYGDFYYLYDKTRNMHFTQGGGFDHYDRSGLFLMRGWNSDSSVWYLYGSRMQFKILD